MIESKCSVLVKTLGTALKKEKSPTCKQEDMDPDTQYYSGDCTAFLFFSIWKHFYQKEKTLPFFFLSLCISTEWVTAQEVYRIFLSPVFIHQNSMSSDCLWHCQSNTIQPLASVLCCLQKDPRTVIFGHTEPLETSVLYLLLVLDTWEQRGRESKLGG